jgi:SAM-dependent methyltransferase
MNYKVARRFLEALWKDSKQFSRKKFPRLCPICGYEGLFLSVGRPSRWDCRCPRCGSRERHRLMWLGLEERGLNLFGKSILHFGPEKFMIEKMRGNPRYEPADLYAKIARFRLDITAIERPDCSFDVVIAHNVLEHIDDDRKAMAELYRVLKSGGLGIFTVPANLSREETYENPSITDPDLRFLHYAGEDHKRIYGRDFTHRLAQVGFEVTPYRRPPSDEVKYGLRRDEEVYFCAKP